MKTMTCRQLGGACDFEHHGDSADEVIKAQDKHLNEVVANGDQCPRAGPEGDEGAVEAPHLRHVVVSEGQA